MPTIQAGYWQNTAKFRFIADSGPTFVCQNNPSTYSLSPNSTNAEAMLPAQMGPTYINGPIEYPPTAIPLQWAEMSESDYAFLAQTMHLQQCTMIDMEDRGYYGMLKLGDFQFATGSAQKVGTVQAVFICQLPSNGVNSVINTLTAPTLVGAITSGGSIPTNTTMFYTATYFSTWGESTPGPVLSVNTGSTANAAIVLSYSLPLSQFFRKARIYVATSAAGLLPGQVANVMGEVWFAFSPQWTDTTGMNGQFNTATIPTINRAFTGRFAGASWLNLN